MRRMLLLALAAGVLCAAGPARGQYLGQPPPPPAEPGAPPEVQEPEEASGPPADDRHRGFYFRADLGGGYLSSSATLPGETGPVKVSLGGGALSLSLAAGGAVVENLVLAAEAWMISATDPVRTAGGASARLGDSSLDLFGMGLQVLYYLPAWNAWAAVTPSFSTLSVREGYVTVAARDGFGLKVGAGKEWRLGGHWGLGVAAQFFLGVNEDSEATGSSWTSLGGALAVTATYN